MTDDKDGLKIGKFRPGALITGPLSWENHLKVAVFVVILFIWWSIYSFVSGLIHKEDKPSVGVINSGGAPVDNSNKKTWWSLFEVNFGGQNK